MTKTEIRYRRALARRLGKSMAGYVDWQLSYLDLALLRFSLGLEAAVVMGGEEE